MSVGHCTSDALAHYTKKVFLNALSAEFCVPPFFKNTVNADADEALANMHWT